MLESKNTNRELEPPSASSLSDTCELNLSHWLLGLEDAPSVNLVSRALYGKPDQLIDELNKAPRVHKPKISTCKACQIGYFSVDC